MNRFRTRTSVAKAGVAVGALVGAVTLVGCGAGQVSQMATQQPAINGTGASIGTCEPGQPSSCIDLRNVHLRAAQTSDYVRPGAEVELIFVAVNGSDSTGDKLVSVTSDIGQVALTGDTEVPAGKSLVVGSPDLQDHFLDAAEGDDVAKAAVNLTSEISNGLLYPFTFTFEKAGEKVVQVPISAGEAPRRDGDVGGEHGAGGH